MIERMINTPSIKWLSKGLDAAWLRSEVISDNIANVDTPNYTASHVAFETLLQDAMDDGFKNRKTRPEHIDFGYDLDSIKPLAIKDEWTDMRMDENNVDMETEMLELARNTIHYNTMVQKLNSEFTRLRTAITG